MGRPPVARRDVRGDQVTTSPELGFAAQGPSVNVTCDNAPPPRRAPEKPLSGTGERRRVSDDSESNPSRLFVIF